MNNDDDDDDVEIDVNSTDLEENITTTLIKILLALIMTHRMSLFEILMVICFED